MTSYIGSAVKPIGARMKESGLLQRVVDLLLRWQRMRRDKAQLLSQPDYLLRDIGIDRKEIEVVLRRARYR